MSDRASWESTVVSLFEDLEQQATGLQLAERDAEVAELTLAEYSRIGLSARLHASQGRELRVRLLGGTPVTGRLARVGEDWCLLVAPSAEWIVRTAALVGLDGLSPRADHEDTWGVLDRLPLRSVLRRLAADAVPCQVHATDDQRLEGRVGRVGRDFLELGSGEGAGRVVHVVPFAAVAALRSAT